MGHIALALLVWACSFGVIVLAWKRRLPIEVAVISTAAVVAIAWGSPLALQR
jgi:hypothetical protein